MKLKAAVELDILRCGYFRQLVNSILFAIGMPSLVNELEVCSRCLVAIRNENIAYTLHFTESLHRKRPWKMS